MNFKTLAVAGIAAVFVSACVGPMQTFSSVRTPFVLEAPELTDATYTAQPGDTLFSQTLTVANAVRLDAAASVQGRSVVRFSNEVPEGETLSLVIVPDLDRPVFCTSYASGRAFELGMTFQRATCFLDQDGDNAFDWILQGWNIDEDRIANTTGGILTNGFPLEQPLPYSRVLDGPLPATELSIVYHSNRFHSSLSPAVRNSEGNRTYMVNEAESYVWSTRTAFRIERDEPFPQTIEIVNLEIEILSFEEGEITYTIRSDQRRPEILRIP